MVKSLSIQISKYICMNCLLPNSLPVRVNNATALHTEPSLLREDSRSIQWKSSTETYLDLGAGESPSEVMTFMLRPRRWCQQCKEWGEGEEDSSREYKVCKSPEAGKGLTRLRKWKKISVTEPDELVGGEAGPWWSEKCLIIGQNIGFGFHSKKNVKPLKDFKQESDLMFYLFF